ncbi:MAG TPA: hypothetical protein VMM15_00180 [Bradyrhizobium sp.]|nr:hypothetical protein [Bradyrhizobium sp.]
MRMLLAAALVAGTVAGLTTTANAAGGCGYGFHPTPYGRCVPNRGVVVVEPPVVVERPVVVVPRGRVCPYGFVWRYGRCRPI